MEIRLGRLLHQSPVRPEKETGRGLGASSESGVDLDLVVPVFSVVVPVVRTKGPSATLHCIVVFVAGSFRGSLFIDLGCP